jgi:hypothetical protein
MHTILFYSLIGTFKIYKFNFLIHFWGFDGWLDIGEFLDLVQIFIYLHIKKSNMAFNRLSVIDKYKSLQLSITQKKKLQRIPKTAYLTIHKKW